MTVPRGAPGAGEEEGEGRPSRRLVLAALVGGGALVATGVGVALVADGGDGEGDGGSSAGGEPTDVPADAALAALGERYLREVPAERDPAVLRAALPALDGSVPADPATQLAALREQVAADYEADEVVELDGWLIARTEGRAAALYVLEG